MKTRFLAMQIKLTSMVVHQAYLDREAKCNSEMGYLYDDNYHVPIDAAQWKTAQLTSVAGHIIFHVLLTSTHLSYTCQLTDPNMKQITFKTKQV